MGIMFYGKATDRFHVPIADLAKGSCGRNPEHSLPMKEFTYIVERLQFGYVGLQEDLVQRAVLEWDMSPKQSAGRSQPPRIVDNQSSSQRRRSTFL